MLDSDIRAAEYRVKAQLASANAQASALPQVRVRHEAAASVWLQLAAYEDRRSAHAREMAERVPARWREAPGLRPAGAS